MQRKINVNKISLLIFYWGEKTESLMLFLILSLCKIMNLVLPWKVKQKD